MMIQFDVTDQKREAEELLDKLRMIDPLAMIAGGAPRDWYFDMAARDLDVYLRMPNHNTMDMVSKTLRGIGMDLIKPLEKKSENSNYANLPNLKWVFEGEFNSIKVNIMVMEKGAGEQIVKDFDVAICQAWFDGKHCYYTEEFDFCIKTRVCLVNKNYNGKEAHVRKMVARFPQFMFCKKLDIATEVNDDSSFDNLPVAF